MKRGSKRNQSASATRFRLWLTDLDRGDTATRGILITDDGALPKPLAWIEGYGPAARHAAERIILGEPIEEWSDSDLREVGQRRCAEMLAGNLLFPIRPFSKSWIDESNPNLAAARYTADAQGFARFSIFTWNGLQSLLMDIPVIYCGPYLERAMISHERSERIEAERRAKLHAAEVSEVRRLRLVAAGSPQIFGFHKEKAKPPVGDNHRELR